MPRTSELRGSNDIISPFLDPITLEWGYQAHTFQSSGHPSTEHARSRRLGPHDRRLRPNRAAAPRRYFTSPPEGIHGGGEDRRQQQGGSALIQEQFDSQRTGLLVSPATAPIIEYPDVALTIAPWTRRKITGYKARRQPGEALTLVQKTFDAHEEKLSLSVRLSAPLIERMIAGHEDCGRLDNAWALTRRTFDAYNKIMPLCAPFFAPWIERMLLMLDACREYREAWKFAQKTLVSYREIDRLPPADLTDAGILVKVLHRLGTLPAGSHECSSLLRCISRGDRLQLLVNPKMPATFRTSLSESLHDPQADDLLVCLHKGATTLRAHCDVLSFWSGYFKARLSDRWTKAPTTDIELMDDFSAEAVRRVFGGFCYSGVYSEEDEEATAEDVLVADYYMIDILKEHLQSVEQARQASPDKHIPDGPPDAQGIRTPTPPV